MGIKDFLKKITGKKEVAPVAVAPQPQIEKPPVLAHRPKPAPMPIKVVSPYALTGGAKTQSDWMLLQIGKIGRAFIAHAEKNKLSVHTPPASADAFVRHDMTAALLAYRLVLTAYHLHQDLPSLEALRIVRTAMVGMLHRAVDITVEQTGRRDQRAQMLAKAEEQFKFTESEVVEACQRLRQAHAQPFAPFYLSLVPAFAPHEKDLHERFGSILHELHGRIEAGMAARNHQITG